MKLIESDKNVNVGTVYLSEGVMLDEVQVEANSMIDVKGRTVIFLSGSDVKASATAISLFQKLPETEYIMDVDSRRRSLISEISYSHQFSDKTSLSAGYQNTVSHSTNTYLTTDYKPILTENYNYVYAKLGQQVGKVYFL